MHDAVENNLPGLVTALLQEQPSDLTRFEERKRGMMNLTPLGVAVFHRHKGIAKLLLDDFKASANVAQQGASLLQVAMLGRFAPEPEFISWLVNEHKQNVQEPAVIWRAAEYGSCALITLLLDLKADPLTVRSDGETLITLGGLQQHYIDLGIDTIEAWAESAEVVRLFATAKRSAGAEFSEREKAVILKHCEKAGSVELFRMVQSDVENAKPDDQGCMFLHRVAGSIYEFPSLLRAVLQSKLGSRINEPTKDKTTALFSARHSVEHFRLLLEHGANPKLFPAEYIDGLDARIRRLLVDALKTGKDPKDAMDI